jgi:hypothetical protein
VSLYERCIDCVCKSEGSEVVDERIVGIFHLVSLELLSCSESICVVDLHDGSFV